MRGRKFAPYEQAHYVRVIQKLVRFHKLMQPSAVKARFFDQADIPDDGLFARRRNARIFPISLIEHKFLIEGKSVQHHSVPFRPEIAETAVTPRFIDLFTVFEKRKRKVIDGGISGRPEIDLIVDRSAFDKKLLLHHLAVESGTHARH